MLVPWEPPGVASSDAGASHGDVYWCVARCRDVDGSRAAHLGPSFSWRHILRRGNLDLISIPGEA